MTITKKIHLVFLIVLTLCASTLFGQAFYSKKVELSYEGKVKGRPVKVNYKIEAENGSLKENESGTISIASSNLILSVSGTITEQLNDGSEKSVPLSDIILPDDRNVNNGWLISHDTYFGKSNIATVKSKLKSPMRLGKPSSKLNSGAPLSLFKMTDGFLDQVK